MVWICVLRGNTCLCSNVLCFYFLKGFSIGFGIWHHSVFYTFFDAVIRLNEACNLERAFATRTCPHYLHLLDSKIQDLVEGSDWTLAE